MNKSCRTAAIVAGALTLAGAPSADTAEGTASATADTELLTRITESGADIVVLGEVHDNPGHHAFQAKAVADLAPAALVFEMLTPEQADATPEARLDSAELEEAFGWADSGWPSFDDYFPIFAAAPEASIWGAGVTRQDARAAIGAGAAETFGPEADRFGLNRALDPAAQAAREAEQLVAHCDALPAEMLPGMVAAQRLRDAVLARTALRALETSGGPVVMITGNGHARTDRGAPAAIAEAAPDVAVLAVGQIETADADPAGEPPFDLVRFTPPAPREDPCAAFR